MEDQFKTLEWFEEKWPAYKKDEPFSAHIGDRNGYAVAFAVSTLQVLFAAVQGPKGGITGVLIIVDTSRSVMIDKLLCADCDIMRSETPIVQLDVMVHYDKKNFDDVAPQYLADAMLEWKNDPKRLITLADVIGFGKTSVKALSGGAVSPR